MELRPPIIVSNTLLFFRILLDKFNDYESKKTQLLHQGTSPSQEELDEVEEMLTNLEKKEAEKCRDIITKLSDYLFSQSLHTESS